MGISGKPPVSAAEIGGAWGAWSLDSVSMHMDSDSVQVRRLEVVETGRRRRWTKEEKIRIVEESLAGRNRASATARRYGIAGSLLFRWRREYRDGHLGREPTGSAGFIPALVVDDDRPELMAQPPGSDGRMEIALPNGCRVLVGRDFDAAALGRVLSVLEGR